MFARCLDLRKLSISEADMKRRPTRGTGGISGRGVASRSSWRMTALPNSFDTLYAAWMRDMAELGNGGWLGRGGSGASFSNVIVELFLRLRGSDLDRAESEGLSPAARRGGVGSGNDLA